MKAKAKVAQLWGYPKLKDTKYRLMKYLLRCELEEGTLLHNTVTRQMVLLTTEETELLTKLPSKPTEQMQELVAGHFLVPEDFDEYKSVKQLRRIYQRRYTGDAINHYIILPTTFCNAHCFYCYESDYPHVHMTEETANRVIDFIEEHRKDKKVSISWFGGEPLVGMARIDQISQGLKDREIPFSSTMISNGYLFDETVVAKSRELWNLRRVQITLDGTEAVYNKVKAYVNVIENPFQRVLRNIDFLSDNGIQVNIRLNVDFYNKDDIRVLIDELGKRYSENKHVMVYLNMLFNNQGFEPVHRSQDDTVELLDIIDGYKGLLKEVKLSQEGTTIPSLQVSQCMADNPHAIMVQPDGSFCRCEHENIFDSYGDLVRGIIDPKKPESWKEIIEKSDYCPECKLYPSCYNLSHCINSDFPCIEKVRLIQEEKSKAALKSVYKKFVEERKNEDI